MLKKMHLSALMTCALAGCASLSSVNVTAQHTGPNAMVIHSKVQPSCGPQKAYTAAMTAAAKETIKAGFDRFIIVKSQGENHTSTVRKPGHWEEKTTISQDDLDDKTTIKTVAKRTPDTFETHGTYDHMIWISFLNKKHPKNIQGINAYEILGPHWSSIIHKDHSELCF